MITQPAGQQPRHRVLPRLTIGLAVLGLMVTTSVVWLVQGEDVRQQEQRMEDARQRMKEIERERAGDPDALEKLKACLQDEACRQERARRDKAIEQLREQYGEIPWRVDRFAPPEEVDTKFLKFIGGAVVTLPVLGCALYVIIAPTYRDADKKWAYGAVGTLLGFWLGAT